MEQPPQGLPQEVPPLDPIPFAQAMPYGQYGDAGPARPGIITAMGIISIVAACFSILFNLFGGIYAIIFFILATNPMFGNNGGASVGLTSPSGFYPAEQQSVILALRARSPLSQRQQQVLSGLLAEQGDAIYSRQGMFISPQTVSATIQSTGPLANGSYYITTGGRIDACNDYAAFWPGAAAPAPNAPRLSGNESGAAVGKITRLASAISPAQRSTLIKLLNSPEQALITPGAGTLGADAQIKTLTLGPDGGLTIQNTGGGMLYVPAAGFSSANATTATAPMPPIHISRTAAALALGEAALSFSLAIYLLVVGILLFRNSRRAGLYHRIYAFAKIPLVILATWAWATVWTGLTTSALKGAPSPVNFPIGSYITGWCIGIGIVALIYPVALLIVVRSRTVKQFFAIQVG